MRKTLAAAAALAAVLAPTGTAHAQHSVEKGITITWGDTGAGHGYGNCGNSSSHGIRDYDLYLGGVQDRGARGNGGHVVKGERKPCTWAPSIEERHEGDDRFGQ